ncbi:MAG: cyclodeaminase/cyclohydrolase family protein [Lachnospiraceae bacterium]|nr:cyclodeaminase/cyclohydrolase family protein [Lachnospiraceae bacterium]
MDEMTIKEFLTALSSDAPTPGGGGAAGLVAAVGTSLGNMVLSLTTGKKKYAEHQSEIEELQKKATDLTQKLTDAMDRDAEAFAPLAKAYGLPKDTPEEAAHRETVMEEALSVAAETPLSMMEEILEAMKLIARVAEIGSRLAISDAGVGIACCQAALQGASLNVFINTKMMKDRDKALSMEERADGMLSEGKDLYEKTYDTVTKAIRG